MPSAAKNAYNNSIALLRQQAQEGEDWANYNALEAANWNQLDLTLRAQNQRLSQQFQNSYRPAELTADRNISYLQDLMFAQRGRYEQALAGMDNRLSLANESFAAQQRMAEQMAKARIPTAERSAGSGVMGDLRRDQQSRPVLTDLVLLDNPSPALV
jgi:hypothetical protein